MKVHISTECTSVEAARGSFDSNKSYQECVDMLCAIGWREADALEVYTAIFPNLYPSAEFGLFKDYTHPQPIFMSEYTDDEKLIRAGIAKILRDSINVPLEILEAIVSIRFTNVR